MPFTTGVAALVIGRDPVVAAAAHPAGDAAGADRAEDRTAAAGPVPDPAEDPLGGDRPRGRSRREERFWNEP